MELLSFVLLPNREICDDSSIRVLGEITAKHSSDNSSETLLFVACNCENKEEISGILALIFAHMLRENNLENLFDLTAFCGFCCRQITFKEDDPLPQYVAEYLQKNKLMPKETSEVFYISTTVEMWEKFKRDLVSQWKKLQKTIAEELKAIQNKVTFYQGLAWQLPS